ncbi:putative steroid-binding protein 3 [Spathaspora sp. JA1]|nr:putative steroid-binding protein 3 [Spathaspora sp. JA1]
MADRNNHFGIIDILRILGGILFFNAFFSWWFTSTPTWGYEGKWLNVHYLKHRITNDFVNLTIDELSLYNGTDPTLPIYIGINGRVYDVSSSRGIYGPKGSYNKLSGKDAARVYVTGCFMNPEEYTYDLRELDQREIDSDLTHWIQFFDNHAKYWYVGEVKHDPIIGDPPKPCQHVKFPGVAHGNR